MKKLALILASTLLAGSMASAQTLWDTMQEQNLFNKVSAGVSLGTFDGLGIYVGQRYCRRDGPEQEGYQI